MRQKYLLTVTITIVMMNPTAKKQNRKEIKMTITAREFVQREIIYCVSNMIHTVNGGYGCVTEDSLADACSNAFDLFIGPLNYEDAAHDAGWSGIYLDDGELVSYNADLDIEHDYHGSWQDICEAYDIEPYETEVFEHWIVSDWLADKLMEKGEVINKNFMGMIIWARTTTGQAISMDAVIQEIYAELVK